MRFAILGPLEVRGASGAVVLGGIKPRIVLAVLLLHANEAVNAERLALALWGEDVPPSAIKSVQVYVSRIRKALGDPETLTATSAGYRLRVRAGDVDAERFASLVADGELAFAAGRAQQAAGVLREALGLWRGPPLADLAFEAFAQNEIARLQEQRLAAIELRVDADLESGRHAAVIGELRRLVAANPARERLAGQLMLALYRNGQQADALEAFHSARRVLIAQIGVEPGPRLRELQRAVFVHDPRLDAGATRPARNGVGAFPQPLAGSTVTPRALEDPFQGFPRSGLDVHHPAESRPAGHRHTTPQVMARTSLRERDMDWAQIADRLSDARAGSGSLLVIEGPAGIGKTELLLLALSRAGDLGLTTLRARGGELERDFSFGVVRQLLEPTLAAKGPRERRALLSGAARLAEPVFRLNGVLPHASAGDGAGGTPDSILHGLHWLCANLANREVLLLALDDVHWADRSSLRFVEYLAPRLEDLPIVMLLAARTGEGASQAELRRITAGARVLTLAPLSAATVCELARERLRCDVSADVGAACHDVTRGNPYLLRELLNSLSDEGIEPGAADAHSVRALAPKAIARAELARLGRLAPGAERLASAVAVLGVGADLRHAATLAGLDEEDAITAVDALVAAWILTPGQPLDFVHPIVRSSIYAESPAAARAVAHWHAAQLLSEDRAAVDRIAAHLLAVPPRADAWIVTRLRAAADAALAAGAPDAAIGYLRRADAEPPSAHDRGELLRQLGTAQASLGEPEALESLRAAIDVARDGRGRAQAGRALGYALLMGGAAVDGVRAWEDALASKEHLDEDLRWQLEADILVAAETTLSSRALVFDRMASARVEIPTLETAAARPMQAIVAAELGHTDGRADDAAELARRALAGGTLMERGGDGSVPILIAVEALVLTDRLAAGKAMLDAVLDSAQSRGSLAEFQNALCLRSQIQCRRAAIGDAEADARLALQDSTPTARDVLRAMKLAGLADALLERGDLAGAEAALSDVLLGPHDPDAILYQPYRDSTARLLLARRKPEAALEHLYAEGEWEIRWGVRNTGFTDWRASAVLALRARGDLDEASRLAADGLAAARAFGSPRAIGTALRTAGLADGPGSIELLRESAAVLADVEGRLEYIRSLVELGAGLRRAGLRSEARNGLRSALDLAHRCGAEALAQRAHEELKVAGAKPRRRLLAGRHALTPSEARIARMAADGMSNREIAQALFLTMKTVAYHLTHAYEKLQISSRAELAEALGSDLPGPDADAEAAPSSARDPTQP